MQNLVIVESPTKARTLTKYLGSGYKIEASMGHIRDLPKGDLGVDVEKNFEPRYVIPRDKKKRVNELIKEAKGAKTLYLATDPDREGEAIAWHLANILQNKNIKRVVFHEITEDAIKHAFSEPRDLDKQLVDAQQARRVLDRLVGYKLSPLLWKKVKRGLSAGRVQTVALRLIVEREKEIGNFKAQEYWTIDASLETLKKDPFIAALLEHNGKKLAVNSEQKKAKNVFYIQNKDQAERHLEVLKGTDYQINSVSKKEVKRYPAAPFTTSTLQQTAGNRLGFSAKKTMSVAQNLYENGLITYMRTDSATLSSQAVGAARKYIDESFGKKYLPNSARIYKSKSKNAQEAHEAIRPTNIFLSPEKFKEKGGLTRDHLRLYDLIWKRTVASQMSEALLDQTTVDVQADNYLLRATGSVLIFDGWLKLYGVKQYVEEDEEDLFKKQVLPKLEEGENLKLLELLPEQHFTQPPPRYTEASLIKKLEELGIGRPSTYAPILSTIQDRFYVEKVEKKFQPTVLGTATCDFLVKYFPSLFDYSFTAGMEDQLDDISRGEREWRETINDFYQPLEQILEKTQEKAERVNLPVETVDKKCPECGKQLVVRSSRFGKFLACSGFPECKHTENFEEKLNIKCPKCGGNVVMKRTRKRKSFYGCSNYPSCNFASWTKPK